MQNFNQAAKSIKTCQITTHCKICPFTIICIRTFHQGIIADNDHLDGRLMYVNILYSFSWKLRLG